MRSFIIRFFLASQLLFCGQVLASEITYNQMVKVGGIEATSNQVFIQGTLNGIIWSSAMVKAQGGMQLFCLPEKLRINRQNLWSLVTDYIKKHRGGEDPFGLTAVLALQEAFPCDY